MPTELPKQYDPAATQARWFPFWEEHGYFNADPHAEKPAHTIMIPLPNVTGALHMGHALNGTVQDLITRWKRMQGYEALWMPGTDHAGIATQAVVERRMLEEEGLTRHDIGREALVNRIWKWKDAYEKRIIGQLKSIGASADWRRTRFTLDEVCSKAVRRTFFKLFKDELIYRGKRLVNWDVHLQTAVANDEVFEEEIDGHFWTFNYPMVDGDVTISFSTTRPETMLGDTAVCVHPSDDRYKDLIGKKVRLPLSDREIPIIADALLADPEKGTGAVKVTPGHDQNDYACYQRNPEIGIIDLFNFDGTLNEHGGEWAGQERATVREAVIARMTELGHYEGVDDRKIPMKHSDRSKTPVETLRSDQWFVKMDDHDDGRPGLAQTAIDAVEDGRVRFYPSRYKKTYTDWLAEKRDWCISRQLWWGHRIPVWSCAALGQKDLTGMRKILERIPELSDAISKERLEILEQYEGEGVDHEVIAMSSVAIPKNFLHVCLADNDPTLIQILEDNHFVQDPDVLDTWFSSALWPHATLGWPDLEWDPPLDAEEVGRQTAHDQGVDTPGSPGESEKNNVLPYFYPHETPADGNASVLITSRDIITLWVARMVLTGLYNMGDIPFRHVHVHPKILDGFGQTMSKSKGNGVDPVDLISKYGTDAIRFTIASMAGESQDVRLPISYECPECETLIPQTIKHQKAKPGGGPKPTVKCPKCKQESQYTSPNYDADADVPLARMVSERFEYGRNFCNKFWNASRFALMNLEGYTPGPVSEDELKLEDRWILSRLTQTVTDLTAELGRYQFDAATRTVRDFTWNEFCDWYLEMIKPRLRDEELRPAAQRVLVAVLDMLIRLLQPFTPFICEELWQLLAEVAPQRGLPEPVATTKSVMQAPWPELPETGRDTSLEDRFKRLRETIIAVRNVRAVYNISPQTPLQLHMRCNSDVAGEMQNVASQFDNLSKTMLASVGADVERPTGSAGFALHDADGFIPLGDVIDTDAEIARQEKEAGKLRGFITGSEKRLSNESFMAKAPPDVVEQARESLAGLQKQLESVEQIIADLGGG
jgi:valyl-tRNA synthetase